MKKIVKRWGNSLVIVFSSEDAMIHNVGEGDVVDISINRVFVKVRNKNK